MKLVPAKREEQVCRDRRPPFRTTMLMHPQFDARPSSFSCPGAGKIQSYCDATDPYCCNGDDTATHEGYGSEYGQDALKFIKGKLGSSGGGSSSAPSAASVSAPTTLTTATGSGVATATKTGGSSSGTAVAQYGQCGGENYTGATTCASGLTCKQLNSWYSQCQ